MNNYLAQLVAEFHHLVTLYIATYAKADKAYKRFTKTGDDAAYEAIIHERDGYEALIEAATEPLADAIANYIEENGNVTFNNYLTGTMFDGDVQKLVAIKMEARRYSKQADEERLKSVYAVIPAPQPQSDWNPWAFVGLD